MIKINEKYKKLVPRPSSDDYNRLKSDIEKNGIEQAIVINSKGEILEGYTRYQIAQELSIEDIPHIVKDFKNDDEEISYVIRVNMNRRHLTVMQKTQLGMQLLEHEKKLAKKRRLSTLKKGDKKPDKVTITPTEKGRATEKVSKIVGVSDKSMKQAVKIDKIEKSLKDEENKKELVETIDRGLEGKTSLSAVYKKAIELENIESGKTTSEKTEQKKIICPHCKKEIVI